MIGLILASLAILANGLDNEFSKILCARKTEMKQDNLPDTLLPANYSVSKIILTSGNL